MSTCRTSHVGGLPAYIPGVDRHPIMFDPPEDTGSDGGTGGDVQQTATIDPNDFVSQVVDRVAERVGGRIDALAQEQTRISERVEELSQPRTNPMANLQRGTPSGRPNEGIRTGEDPLTSRGYSVCRVLGALQGYLSPDNAKPEFEISRQLFDGFVTRGGMAVETQGSFLMPFGVAMIPSEALGDMGISEDNRRGMIQCMRAGLEGFDLDRAQWLGGMIATHGYGMVGSSTGPLAGAGAFARQDLSIYDDTGLGNFLGPTSRGEMIELVRNREALSRAGATQFTLPPNGRIRFDRQTGATSATWIGEVPSDQTSPTIATSEVTTGTLDLIAKKLAVIVKLPNDLLRFATMELEAFIRRDLARTFALEFDLKGLEGLPNGINPKGIIHYANILTRAAGTEATNGDTFEPEDVNLMLSDVEEANHDPEQGFSFLMRPKMWANITNRRAAAHTAGTYDGAWLFPVNRDNMNVGVAPALSGHQVVKSTQISNTRSKGSSSDLTYVLGGIFSHLLIGRAGVLEFSRSVEGDTPFQTDQTWLRAIQHMDSGPRYEKAFVFVDDVDMDLPA